MNKKSKIYVAGHTGLVGSALMRRLTSDGYTNIITRPLDALDLRNQVAVNTFFVQEKPEYVFLAAARVGGIWANTTYRADFLYDNMMIAANVIHAAYVYGVKKLLNLGSSCIYPKNAQQPLREEYLLSGALEETNEPYAIAKIAAIKLCAAYNVQYGTNFISVMPTNLYGPSDNFNLETAHVLPALIRKFHEAKINAARSVTIWGTGRPLREFLYVDDLIDAVVFLMKQHDAKNIGECINIGTGVDVTIEALACIIQRVVGFNDELVFDHTKPDGTARKLLDVKRMHALGWKYQVELEEGIEKVYDWYTKSIKKERRREHETTI